MDFSCHVVRMFRKFRGNSHENSWFVVQKKVGVVKKKILDKDWCVLSTQGNRWKLFLNIDSKFDFQALFTFKQTFSMIPQTTAGSKSSGFPEISPDDYGHSMSTENFNYSHAECWDRAYNTMIKLFHKVRANKKLLILADFQFGESFAINYWPKAASDGVVATLPQPQGWLPFSSQLSSFWSSPLVSIKLRQVAGSLSPTTGLLRLCLSMKHASHSSGSSGLTFVISYRPSVSGW